ncbi:pentapeptide repeat-containing protein [Tabrizicola sp.]|uniref:pentapeptide repeat-containing protein n=1 Tax=Tabrizicola sp. TaxID=2005166 RepID=UPI00286BA025|nr:pentapeptide repeat-containing protein [Tabrizicola sp.]
MEILCAYVRENAKAEHLTLTEPTFTIKAPRIDIQKAMDVIKRRSAAQKALEAIARYRLDLRSVDFDGVDLSKGDLSGAILVRSRFEGASLEHTNLTGSQMQGCLLNCARWHGVKLRGTFLDHCTLNRPKPTPGGFNEYGPTMGGIDGLSVIASDLTAISYFGENPETIFGSRDTQLSHAMDELRKTASSLFRSREAAERRKDLTKIAEYDAELSTNSFKHWVPFDGSDMAVGHYHAKRFTALGLTGWPIDD